MLRFILTSCLVVTFLVACTVGAQQQSNSATPVTEDKTVYSLSPLDDGTTALRQAAQDLGYVAGPDRILGSLGLILVRYSLPNGVTGKEAIDALEARVPTATVGVNHAYTPQNLNMQTAKIYAAGLMGWPQNACTAKVRVGMIDGAVDPGAPALAGVSINRKAFDSSSSAGLKHGTEVASVIADPARVSAVSLFSAEVMIERKNGVVSAGAAQIAQALNWLVGENVRVVNMSFAGPKNKLLNRAVTQAAERGLVMVASVGNVGKDAPPQFPAAFESVLAVTAVDVNRRVFRRAGRGDHVDISAPGVDIFVPSETGGRYATGTSMAAPFVTALIATQKQFDRDSLFRGATDLGAPGKDAIYGHGLVNAAAFCKSDQ